MKKIFFILALLALSAATPAFAANEAQQMRSQASNDMMMARQLIMEAKQMLTEDRSAVNMKASISLYTRAGQMLERAMNIYTQLAPDNASEQEIVNAQKGVELCISSIREIQRHFPREETA